MEQTGQQAPRRFNALEAIKLFKRHADTYSAAAAEYLELLTSAPRPAVKVGGFYRTFDGSFVFVARKLKGCRCDLCTGRAEQVGFFLGVPILRRKGGESAEAVEGTIVHEEAADDAIYAVLVLDGGHGISDAVGEKPGEAYVIDSEGYVTNLGMPENILSKSILGFAGLSLRTAVEVRATNCEEMKNDEGVDQAGDGPPA